MATIHALARSTGIALLLLGLGCHRATPRERVEARLAARLPAGELLIATASVARVDGGSSRDELFIRFDETAETLSHFCSRLGARNRPVGLAIRSYPPTWWPARKVRSGCGHMLGDGSPVDVFANEGHVYVWVGPRPEQPS